MLGYEAHHQLRLPLPVLTIAPANACRQQTHITGILYDEMGRYQRQPGILFALKPLFKLALLYIEAITSHDMQ